MRVEIRPRTWGGSIERGETSRDCGNCHFMAVDGADNWVCSYFQEAIYDPFTQARNCEAFTW